MAVLLLAFVVRSARLTVEERGAGVVEYDDGVHLAAAHPPGRRAAPYQDFPCSCNRQGSCSCSSPSSRSLTSSGSSLPLVFMRLAFVLDRLRERKNPCGDCC